MLFPVSVSNEISKAWSEHKCGSLILKAMEEGTSVTPIYHYQGFKILSVVQIFPDIFSVIASRVISVANVTVVVLVLSLYGNQSYLDSRLENAALLDIVI